MQTYLYIPEDEEILNYFDKAKDSNISQIIQGPSDIIEKYVEDYSKPFIIKIPEYRGFWMETFVFPENKDIQIIFIDEWVKDENYISVDAIIFKVDIEDPSMMDHFMDIKMGYDGGYTFYEKIKIDTYGEYLVKIIANYENDTRKILDQQEFVVFKEIDSEVHDFDFGI
jgi:hypothetical protein